MARSLAQNLDTLLMLNCDISTAEELLATLSQPSLLPAFPSIIPPNPHPPIPSPMSSSKPAELQLEKSKAFNGSYETVISWMHSIQFYLAVNEKSYDTNTKKIVFNLSYMNEGSILTWADIF